MSKRFLDEEDQSALQTEINAVRSIAENASTTVKQVSTVAQQAADDAQEAARNALNAYSPTNKPSASDVGARPDTWFPTPEQIGAALEKHTHAYDNAFSPDSDNAVQNKTITAKFDEINQNLNNKSNNGHVHSASSITSGILDVARGGTGSDTLAGSLTNLLGGTQNQIYNLTDYANFPYGITEGVYSGLKTNDPFTVTGAKRIYAVRTKGSSDSISTIIVTCLDGGDDTGRTVIGYCNGGTVRWTELYGTHNITYGTAALTDGVSKLPTGHIYLQYEE